MKLEKTEFRNGKKRIHFGANHPRNFLIQVDPGMTERLEDDAKKQKLSRNLLINQIIYDWYRRQDELIEFMK